MKRPNIDAIIAREKAATEGPWEGSRTECGPGTGVLLVTTGGAYIGKMEHSPSNCKPFIAHARQDIPDLTDYALALEAKIAEALGGISGGWEGDEMVEWAETMRDLIRGEEVAGGGDDV